MVSMNTSYMRIKQDLGGGINKMSVAGLKSVKLLI